MKKNLLLLATFGLLLIETKAQVSISKNDIPGVFLTTGVDSEEQDFDIPATGAGQTWNYSDFTPADTSWFGLAAVSGTPDARQFPDATLYSGNFGSIAGDSSETFFKTGANGLYVEGTYDSTSSTKFSYVWPELIFPAPIGYNQTLKDSSKTEVDSSFSIATINFSFSHVEISRITYVGVGYGKIITPAGTFPNTLLVKQTRIQYDTTKSSYPKPTARTGLDTSYSYLWFQADKTFPVVFEIDFNSDGSSDGATYYTKQALLAVTPAQNGNFTRQYPMPADQSLAVELNKPMDGVLTLFGMDGSVKSIQQSGPTTKYNINTGNLPSGVYSYEIKSSDGSLVRNKIVVTH